MRHHPTATLTSYATLAKSVRQAGIVDAVVVGSSPRGPAQLAHFVSHCEQRPTLFLGLNAAIGLVTEAASDSTWSHDWWAWSVACDWRAAAGLADMFGSSLGDDVVRVWTGNVKAAHLLPAHSDVVNVTYLGDVGFSERPDVGVYSGYTVAYVASQLLLLTDVQRVTLIGVDLSYGSTASARYYGGQTGPMDLHVLGRQIENMRNAVARLRQRSITVETPGPHPRWFIDAATAINA